MTKEKQDPIEKALTHFIQNVFYFLKRCFLGAKNNFRNPKKIGFFLMWLVIGILITRNRGLIWNFASETFEFPEEFKGIKTKHFKQLLAISLLFPFLYLSSLQANFEKIRDKFNEEFERIAFHGRSKRKTRNEMNEIVEIKDYPEFMGIEEKSGTPITLMTFHSYIKLKDWEERVLDIEVALNQQILQVVQAKDSKRIVVIHTIPNHLRISEKVLWNDDYMINKKGVVRPEEMTVGENLLDTVRINLDKVPHMLVAGQTGSGKSVIMRCMLYQLLKGGSRVFMADFKGGVEFVLYKQYGIVLKSAEHTIQELKEIVVEHNARENFFYKIQDQCGLELKSITEYNEYAVENGLPKLCRIAVLVDELADFTAKKGVSKERKKLVEEAEGLLSKLARKSRFTGINLILGTQRPDAETVTGQIKANLTGRICGSLQDEPTSRIVLDSSSATSLPPIPGRLIYKNGSQETVFQSYFFKDDNRKKLDYKEEGILITEHLEEFQKKVGFEISLKDSDEQDYKEQKLKAIERRSDYFAKEEAKAEKEKPNLDKSAGFKKLTDIVEDPAEVEAFQKAVENSEDVKKLEKMIKSGSIDVDEFKRLKENIVNSEELKEVAKNMKTVKRDMLVKDNPLNPLNAFDNIDNFEDLESPKEFKEAEVDEEVKEDDPFKNIKL